MNQRSYTIPRYMLVIASSLLGLIVITIQISSQTSSNILTYFHVSSPPFHIATASDMISFICVLGMICIGLLSLLIPESPSLASDLAEITGKIAEPNLLGSSIEKEISESLDHIIKTLRNHSEVSQAFSNALEVAGRNLIELTSPEQLRLAIGYLIAENNKMRRETTDLQSDLTTSKLQIENLRQNLEVAEETGMRDSLTSIWNRRAFDKMLDAQIEISPHKNSPLSLIMADIDHFKKINDNFGHLIGDEILRLVASTISQNVKGRDVVARFGGEEFAIILPDTKLANALTIALQIKRKLETQKWVLRQRKEVIGNVTASFGVAEYIEGEKKARLLQRTDEMLYKAKNTGRNRVVG
jgi:diguanylate cyclase